MGNLRTELLLYVGLMLLLLRIIDPTQAEGDDVASEVAAQLEKFVDEIPKVPKLYGFRHHRNNNKPSPNHLKIGMFYKKWKFHRDLPPTPVFAYGTSKHTATIPGPTIIAHHGIPTYVTWENHLPSNHILPLDTTIPTAIPKIGIPTVVHLHGGIHSSESDGHAKAWFTSHFNEKGPTWSTKTYTYLNNQQPGNMYYHDHAMGLTRVNLLAGLTGAYIVQHPEVEEPLGLPNGDDEFDRTLVITDKSFLKNGSIYMDPKGNNPTIHPVWQPEYFGDVIIVNGKAWPKMTVHRRKYRVRIINTSNARFYRFRLTNGQDFIHIGSDSAYLSHPVRTKRFLLAPSEIADIIIDFSNCSSSTSTVLLVNDAPYPYPSGDPVNPSNSMIMKFIIKKHHPQHHEHPIPTHLLNYPSPDISSVANTRYISMFEYTSAIDEPTHLYINGLSYDDPVTEFPKQGTSEVWNVINLTEDNHPLHLHLGLFKVLDQTHLLKVDEFRDCMKKVNDTVACHLNNHLRGKRISVPAYEKGWKNVFKMRPGFLTRLYVTFSYIHTNDSYSFNVVKGPGYAYHCHILDHEDNVMMRPFKVVS